LNFNRAIDVSEIALRKNTNSYIN